MMMKIKEKKQPNNHLVNVICSMLKDILVGKNPITSSSNKKKICEKLKEPISKIYERLKSS